MAEKYPKFEIGRNLEQEGELMLSNDETETAFELTFVSTSRRITDSTPRFRIFGFVNKLDIYFSTFRALTEQQLTLDSLERIYDQEIGGNIERSVRSDSAYKIEANSSSNNAEKQSIYQLVRPKCDLLVADNILKLTITKDTGVEGAHQAIRLADHVGDLSEYYDANIGRSSLAILNVGAFLTKQANMHET